MKDHGRFTMEREAVLNFAKTVLRKHDEVVLVGSSPLSQPGRAAVTRQIASPTSSATSKEPSGPIATPTGRP